MSFGRGKILQAIKRDVDGEVADDLQHQLRMSWASDYTNQSIEKFCHQLAERCVYESSVTCGQTFGEMSVLHSDQFDDSEDYNSGISEALCQKANEVSSPSSYLKEMDNNDVLSTSTKSSCSRDNGTVQNSYRTYQSNDKKNWRWRKRVRAKKTSFSQVTPKQEIDDCGIAVNDEAELKILNGNSGVANVIEPAKMWRDEDEASPKECDGYFDGINNHASTSKVHFRSGNDGLNSCCSKEKLPLSNPQSKTGATMKVIGRGQRLQMVVESLNLNSQREISMGCDPAYTNQSIENYLDKLMIKNDEEGCY